MKTLNFFSALKNKGYNAVLNRTFSYRIDKNRHYYVVTIDSAPDRELISLAESFGLMWVACTYVNTSNDIEYSVKFDAMPKDMKSFDFVEYKVFYNDNVNEPALLDKFANTESAILFANSQVEGKEKVESGDNINVHANAGTARIEVYEGDKIVIVNGEPELREPVYTTEYFYNK